MFSYMTYTEDMKGKFFGRKLTLERRNGVITYAPRDLKVYKKTLRLGTAASLYTQGHIITTLIIPKGTRVRWSWYTKCRAARAIVIAHSDHVRITKAFHNNHFRYVVGKIVEPESPFNDWPTVECGSGIHFFLTRDEAAEFVY